MSKVTKQKGKAGGIKITGADIREDSARGKLRAFKGSKEQST